MTDHPQPEWQRRLAAKEPGELFRYKQRGATLIYSLRVADDGQMELHRLTERTVQQPTSAKLGSFADIPQVETEVKKTRRMLESDGWKEVL